ncbi:hypothetical protein NU195Hw_g1353t1 [Hortaea werneckii]
MSDKAETPDTTKCAIKTTRTGDSLLSSGGIPHEHSTNALNPQRAYGTAASQFWFELGFHVIEILVRGNKTYTLQHRANHRDLRALVRHPAMRTKEMLLFAYRRRNELNIFNEQDPSPGSTPRPPPSATPQYKHMNFHFTLQLPYSPRTLCGFDLARALLIPHRFPNLKSIVINLDVRLELERQSFVVPETMRKRSATVLLLLGIASNATDAVARKDKSCLQEWKLISGVLVKVVKHLRGFLGERVERRHVNLTRSGGGYMLHPQQRRDERAVKIVKQFDAISCQLDACCFALDLVCSGQIPT